jgi:hypothetical protein
LPSKRSEGTRLTSTSMYPKQGKTLVTRWCDDVVKPDDALESVGAETSATRCWPASCDSSDRSLTMLIGRLPINISRAKNADCQRDVVDDVMTRVEISKGCRVNETDFVPSDPLYSKLFIFGNGFLKKFSRDYNQPEQILMIGRTATIAFPTSWALASGPYRWAESCPVRDIPRSGGRQSHVSVRIPRGLPRAYRHDR